MAIEVWSSDEHGMLALMPESPDPDAPHGGVPVDATPPAPEAPAPPPEPSQADELRVLRRMAEDRQQEAARLSGQMDTVTKLLRGEDLTPPAETTPAPLVRPKNEDFTTFEEYEEARDTYFKTVAKQEAAQEVAAYRQEQQHEYQRQALAYRVHQSEQAFAQAHPDYVEVVTNGIASKTPKPFRDFIQQVLGDDAAAVAYHMSKDDALTQRLMQMPIDTLRYALGQLSASVGGGPTAAGTDAGAEPPPAEPPPVPSVPVGVRGGSPTPPVAMGVPPAGRPKPAPPRPLGGGSPSVPGGYRDDMSQAEYRAYRAAGGQ